MRKKQLLAENSGFFAEIERKNTELEILKIRLKEKTDSAEKLRVRNVELEETVAELKKLLLSSARQIEELEITINGLKKSGVKEVPLSVAVEETKEAEEPDYLPSDPINRDIENVISGLSIHEEKKSKEAPVYPKITEEQRVELRNIGAAAIGRVTKIAAYVTGKLQTQSNDNSDRLYSLALGKNESFKIQVSKLVESEGNFEDICRELERKSDMAVSAISELIE